MSLPRLVPAPISAEPSIAIILPSHNEALSIAGVVAGFRAALPGAGIYVIDNASTDDTGRIAQNAGATVISEQAKGKGNAVRRAFSDVEADIYVMADGDGTYDAARARAMIDKLLSERLDMVVGVRRAVDDGAYRAGHRSGNQLFNLFVRRLFGDKFTDIFSGYRVFSRRFVKSFPALSRGFEIETEISVHAIHLRLPTGEVETDYFERADGSASKLKTYRDGFRILMKLVVLLKAVRPLGLFSAIAVLLFGVAIGFGMPIVWYFVEHHTVPRLPTIVGVAGLIVLSAISFITGIILDSVMLAETAYKRLFYLSLASAGHTLPRADPNGA